MASPQRPAPSAARPSSLGAQPLATPGGTPVATYAPPLEVAAATPAALARSADPATPDELSSSAAPPPSHPDSTLGWTFEYSALPQLGPTDGHHAPESAQSAGAETQAESASYLADEGSPATTDAVESPYRDEIRGARAANLVSPPAPADAIEESAAADYAPGAWAESSGSATGAAAATALESIARRLRTGELLPVGTHAGMSEEALLAATLAALLGARG